jgi:hypothetical protein
MITALIIWNIVLTLAIIHLLRYKPIVYTGDHVTKVEKKEYPSTYNNTYINLEDADTSAVIEGLKQDYGFMMEISENLNRLQVHR